MIVINNTYLRIGRNKRDGIKQATIWFMSIMIVYLLALLLFNQPYRFHEIIFVAIISLVSALLLWFFCPAKRLIINNHGILLLNKKNDVVHRQFFLWDDIVKIEYRASFINYRLSIWSYNLYITYVCRKSNGTNTSLMQNNVMISLNDYLSEYELYKTYRILKKRKSSSKELCLSTKDILYRMLNEFIDNLLAAHPKVKFLTEIRYW